jgi:hypothetical protein
VEVATAVQTKVLEWMALPIAVAVVVVVEKILPVLKMAAMAAPALLL